MEFSIAQYEDFPQVVLSLAYLDARYEELIEEIKTFRNQTNICEQSYRDLVQVSVQLWARYLEYKIRYRELTRTT